MTSALLERIELRLPGTHPEFHGRLLSVLADLGTTDAAGLSFSVSQRDFYPRIRIAFDSPETVPIADFHLSGGGIPSVRIENTTGLERRNPLPYRPLALDDAVRRLANAGWKISGADHIGFNLPWFGPGLHPRIAELRQRLAAACLYHTYPTGEPWDFILPGDGEEIAGRRPVDYSATRRPKFELVSFDGASTPLVQIDVGVNASFEVLSSKFPEAIADTELRNIWVYLENPYPIDVCLVIGERAEGDWSGYFTGRRLLPR
jgi:hypothetical protein